MSTATVTAMSESAITETAITPAAAGENESAASPEPAPSPMRSRRKHASPELAQLRKEGIAVVILSDVLWEELQRNAEACGLPVKSFVRDILESEAASLRLPNVEWGDKRDRSHLPGNAPDADAFPFPLPGECHRVHLGDRQGQAE